MIVLVISSVPVSVSGGWGARAEQVIESCDPASIEDNFVVIRAQNHLLLFSIVSLTQEKELRKNSHSKVVFFLFNLDLHPGQWPVTRVSKL